MTELHDFFERLDLDAADRLYRRVSVDPSRFHRTLHTAGRPCIKADQATPSPDDLATTGRWVIEQACLKSGVFGGIAGLTGIASVPAEITGQGLALLRLAQRLCIIYGFEPGTDRGNTALWRVLAAGLNTELPTHGPVSMRATALPGVLTGRQPRALSGVLARALFRRTARSVLHRVLRLVPLASVVVNARTSRQRTREIGERMLVVLDRLHTPTAPTNLIDAVEV